MDQDDFLGRVDALLAGMHERYEIRPSIAVLLDSAPTPEIVRETVQIADAESEDSLSDGESFPDFESDEYEADWEEFDEGDLQFNWYVFQQNLPKLDHDRQIELAASIEAGVLARGVLDGEFLRRETWTNAELEQLAEQGENSRQEMILGNLPLVMHWARRSSSASKRYPIEDRFQDGIFGLLRAIEKWDYFRGYTFSTYATWHIRQQISRHTDENAYLIRIPIHVQDKWKAAKKAGVAPSDQWEDARRLVMGILSWEFLMEIEYEELLADESDPLLRMIDELAEAEVISQLLARLPLEWRDILSARSGLGGCEPRTLDSIGIEMGVTRERVRQIENKITTSASLAYWTSVHPFLDAALQLAREEWRDGDAYLGILCLDPTATLSQVLSDFDPSSKIRRYAKLVLTDLMDLLMEIVQICNEAGGPFEAPLVLDEIKNLMVVKGSRAKPRVVAEPSEAS
jgi:hypothetical protein